MRVEETTIGVVVIGRNEGERLKRCLASLPANATVVYVDSGSTDDSVTWALNHGADVVILDATIGFTAARARNAGFLRLKSRYHIIRYVQFVDGDCELASEWLEKAAQALDANSTLCAVFGRRRERFPQTSIYNLLCDIEWDVPVGPAKAFGGDVLVRADVFEVAQGYCETLIAGEEPELSLRLRQHGWGIERLDLAMTTHDAAILSFGQWWRRQSRSGFAFAEGSFLHGSPPERHWVWERNRSLLWGLLIPINLLAISIALWPGGLVVWTLFPLQITRLYLRSKLPSDKRLTWALFQPITRFPEACGVMRFWWNHFMKRQVTIIDYKSTSR